MARIEFTTGLEGEENLPRTNRELKMCFNNGKGQVLSLPGIKSLNTTGKVARGQFEWNDSLYQVTSNDLIKITNTVTGAFSVIGTIAGSEVIEWAIGFNEAVIVVKGGALYTLDKTDTLVNISGNSNISASVDVAHIDGHFIYIPSDGTPAKFSDEGDGGTIQPLSFIDAEELPDRNNGVINFKNTLFIAGTDSIELFRSIITTDPVPFARINGARLLTGYIGGLLEYKDTFLFLGREKDQDFGIYALVQGRGEKISNSRIDLILSTYTSDQLAMVIAQRFKWRGYDFAHFRLPNDSFSFVLGNWPRTESASNGTAKPWGLGFVTQFEGEYFTAFEGNIGKLDKINTHYGDPFERSINFGIEQADNDRFSCQSLELGVSQGFNAAEGSVALQVSDDNVLFSQPLFRSTGKIGEYEKKLVWNYGGGMGNYDGYMGVRLSTFEDLIFNNDSLVINLR